jgi:hypothetical protein
MKRTIVIVITMLLVVSFFASPQLNAPDVVLAQRTGGGAPTTYRPDQETYTQYPTYTWSRAIGAVSYTLAVYDNVLAKNVFRKSISTTYCSTSSSLCSFTPGLQLVLNRAYRWKVSASFGTSEYFSFWRPFKVQEGLNNSFDHEFYGWEQLAGGTWYYTVDGNVQTDGASGVWSNMASVNIFRNFTYEVKMKRNHATMDGAATSVIVRGTGPLSTGNDWDTAYRFSFAPIGQFGVWKEVGEVSTTLITWTPTTSILPNNWNKLKITMDNNKIRFYINNILVWSGVDTGIYSGKVGLSMFQQGDAIGLGNNLVVDWAKLGMSDYFKAAEMVKAGQVELQPTGSEPMVPEHTP